MSVDNNNLENRQVRTRFAPSPTGSLHVGGARTALFAWAYARAHAGVFLLRIEDTDRARHDESAVAGIIKSMHWLGLDYDEELVFQSQRTARYQEVMQQLLDSGHAYRCYCSHERLDALREEQMQRGDKPRYDGHCRAAQHTAAADAAYVVRFKNPESGSVVFVDGVRGRIEVANSELDDLIIARSDGSPTYNFTVVVDDLDMRISHVVRGDDHINNTPRQINIFRALGAAEPVYAHVPSILGEDGRKLSKRRGALGVMDYAEQGILPEALLNYLVRLGWSHQDDEILGRADIIKYFDFPGIQRSPAALHPDKLLWLNQHYIKTLDIQDVASRLLPIMQQRGLADLSTPPLLDVVLALRERANTLLSLAEQAMLFYADAVVWDEKARAKQLKPSVLPALELVLQRLEALATWEVVGIHKVLHACVEELGIKFGRLAQPLRTAVTGGAASPSLDVTLALLGRDRVQQRVQQAIVWVRALS